MQTDQKSLQKVLVLSGKFTARYIYNPAAKNAPVFILLHGYSQTGEVFLKKLASILPEGAGVLAPNGPFPVPESDGKGYRLGFSWYFYEPKVDEYYIDMELGRNYVASLIESLGLNESAKIIVGYSQGGYIAPFVAAKLKNVRQVLGINCQFLDEEMPEILPCPMDQVQGSEDQIVTPENSKKSFEKLVARGMKGTFVEVKGASHGLTPPLLEEVSKLLKQYAK